MTLVPAQPLVGEAHLGQTQARLAGDVPAVDIAVDAVDELVAAHDGHDGKRLDARVGGGVELGAAVALGARVVVAQDDEGVDVGVEVFDRLPGVRGHLRLEGRLALPGGVVGAAPGAVAVDVDVGVAVGCVLEVDGARGRVFTVVRVRAGLAGRVGDGDGFRAFSLLFFLWSGGIVSWGKCGAGILFFVGTDGIGNLPCGSRRRTSSSRARCERRRCWLGVER